MNVRKYAEDLEKRWTVNTQALNISEKGVDMEKKKALGFYSPSMRTGSGDVIIKVETTGLEPRDKVISLARIDEDGLTIVTRSDRGFSRKMKQMLSDLDGKRVFFYNKEFTMQFLRNNLAGSSFEAVDLMVEASKILGLGFGESAKNSIEIPWDPCTPEGVPDFWNSGLVEEVKRHAVAEAIRLHHLYEMYVMGEAVGAGNSAPAIHGQRGIHIFSTTGKKVKLPSP